MQNTSSLIEKINLPTDLRILGLSVLKILSSELRVMLNTGKIGHPGHLASSLGVVELTIALHYVFNTPSDRLVWDVGHQTYAHKVLTGRKEALKTIRKLNGISGFPSRSESEYDSFGVGHSSTAVSAALGMALASARLGETDRKHIAIVGDGAMTAGMFFEALNHAGELNPNLLIILNDNGMSIDPTMGALRDYLANQAEKASGEISNPFFEAFGVQCFGPVDGNNLDELIPALEAIKDVPGLKLLHLITHKGKPSWSVPAPCDPDYQLLYQDVFGKTMIRLAEENEKIMVISPAMLSGSSLTGMKKRFPERTFDTAIAEQHAVTLAAGMATEGLKPYCCIYSTFFQRAYDQVIHDVALQKLPVVFCLDRAGLVGEDGATHHGVFDLAFLRCIPNLVIAAPMDETELASMMYSSQFHDAGPFVIRYPRGKTANQNMPERFEKIETGKGRKLRDGDNVAVVSLGKPGNEVVKALDSLEIEGISVAHFDLRFLKPLDESLLHEVFSRFKKVITVEDGVISGGMGSALMEFAHENGYQTKIKRLGVPDRFISHGTISELYAICGMDAEAIRIAIRDIFI
ncbi:MAG: 1-deoxy-D-xylulose-5-phosphate synthase [Bacteroidales bacterium]